MSHHRSAPQLSAPSNSSNDLMYRTLVTQSPDAIILHDHDRFVYVNPSCIKLLAADGERELLNRSLTEFITPEYQQVFTDLIEDLEHQYVEVRPVSFPIVNFSGAKLFIEMTATSTFHNGGKVVLAILRDASDRKILQDLREVNQRWKITRQLIGHLADKTLNPLAVIDGFLKLLKEGDSEVNLEVLQKEVDSINHIFQELISYSQGEAPHTPKPTFRDK